MILELMEELVEEELEYGYEEIDRGLLREFNKKLLQDKRYRCIEYEYKGEILGFILIQLEKGEICEIYVRKEHRARGIGHYLMRVAYGNLINRGFDKVRIRVNQYNNKAYRLYKSERFREIGCDGDIITLEKELKRG